MLFLYIGLDNFGILFIGAPVWYEIAVSEDYYTSILIT